MFLSRGKEPEKRLVQMNSDCLNTSGCHDVKSEQRPHISVQIKKIPMMEFLIM